MFFLLVTCCLRGINISRPLYNRHELNNVNSFGLLYINYIVLCAFRV